MSFKTQTTIGWAGDEYKAAMPIEMLEGYKEGGERIAKTARSLIHNVSGALARTIRVGVSKVQQAVFVFAGSLRDRIYYGPMLEYGTYDKAAHPFMRPAIDRNFNAVEAEAAHAGQRVINKNRRMRRTTKTK